MQGPVRMEKVSFKSGVESDDDDDDDDEPVRER